VKPFIGHALQVPESCAHRAWTEDQASHAELLKSRNGRRLLPGDGTDQGFNPTSSKRSALVAFSPDGSQLAASFSDEAIVTWRAPQTREDQTEGRHGPE